MNKLLLLFIVVIIAIAFADDANFRTKDSSGKSFKEAMNGAKASNPTPTPTRAPPKVDRTNVSSKLKLLEETLSTKSPKKLVPSASSDSDDPYDSTKFGSEMAELARRITGESIPSFVAPPATAEEGKYKETVQERERRHRRQSSYGDLLESIQSTGASTPAAKELLSKLTGENMQKLQEDSSIYNRNSRPKFVPTVILQDEANRAKEMEEAIAKKAEKDAANKVHISQRVLENEGDSQQDLKMKPAKNRRRTEKAEKPEKKETPSNLYKIQLGDFNVEVDVDKIKEFFVTPQGRVVQAVAGYFIIVMVIRLLRLYKLLSFARGLINMAFFVAIAGLVGLAFSENPEQPHVLIQQKLELYADLIRYIVPRAFGILAVLNLFSFSRLTFVDTLHFALVAGVGLHFKGTKLELLETAHFLPLYLSAFSLLALLSFVSIFTSSAKPVDKKEASMIVKEEKAEKAEAKKSKNSDKDDQVKKRSKSTKVKSEKSETEADEN